MGIGKLVGVLFIGGFSALLGVSGLRTFSVAVSQQGWVATECQIVAAELPTSSSSEVAVRYTYVVDGITREGNRWALPSPVQPSYRDLLTRVEKWQPGTVTKCWRDPNDGARVVLERESLWVGTILLFPLAGITAIYFLLRPRRTVAGPARGSSGTGVPQSFGTSKTSQLPASSGAGKAVYFFFLLFVVVGLGLTYLFFGRHYLAAQRAKSWVSGECTILSSEVLTHTSKDSKSNRTSTSYSIKVAYTLNAGGKTYSGSTYSVGDSQHTDSSSAYEAIQPLDAGKVVPCFFDPSDPTESTLKRDLESTVWLGLFPLLFTVAGLMGLGYTWQSRRTDNDPTIRGKKVRRASNRLVGFITLLCATTVWNGIVGVGGYAFFTSGDASGWLIALFISPFALIGVLLIVALPLAFLQIFNPSVDFELASSDVPFDGTFSVGWKLRGSPRRVRLFTLALELVALEGSNTAQADGVEGVELENDVRRSASPTPQRTSMTGNVIRRFELAKTSNRESIRKGSAEVRIPAYETFSFPNNTRRIKWRLTAGLSIPWYPDSSETMELDPREGTMTTT
jgi:hypothetical protein